MKKRQIFFGGHPVSITRQSREEIFTLPAHNVSPFLVCEKSDGVRYLLVIAKVLREDATRPLEETEHMATQCYFVSRKGHQALDASIVDVGVSFDMDFAEAEIGSESRHVIEILDGELVLEHKAKKPYFKYLIFDALVHLGRNICQMSLGERLVCVQKFLQCNEMLGIPACNIPIELKDFFRLTNRKFNVIDFLLRKYISQIEHENDGLIFNHEDKEYVIGTTNPGYIKWKPEHLNTVDFMIIPNRNLEDQFGRRVIDLYAAVNDADLGRYTKQFYAFMVVSEEKYYDICQIVESREQDKIDRMMEENEDYTEIDEFGGALIAECNYDAVETAEERNILGQLTKQSNEDIRMNLMKQGLEERDNAAISECKKRVYTKNWKIYKIREDKQLPNNMEVVKRI
jgi:hypothetical protein